MAADSIMRSHCPRAIVLGEAPCRRGRLLRCGSGDGDTPKDRDDLVRYVIDQFEAWRDSADESARREMVERLIDVLIGHDARGRPVPGHHPFAYLARGPLSAEDLDHLLATLDSLRDGDEQEQRETGEYLMTALRRDEAEPNFADDVYGVPIRLDPLSDEETRRAIELLRSWREGSDEDAEEQRITGDVIERALETDPIRFREVDLDR